MAVNRAWISSRSFCAGGVPGGHCRSWSEGGEQAAAFTTSV